jgi:RHS repeat-associated protein
VAIASPIYFMYDEAGHLVGEYDSSGNLIQETVWLGDIPVATLRPNGANVDVFYVHTDQLNTPRKVSRPSDNALRWRWDPTPFGEGVPDQNPASIGTFVYNLRFPGQQFDVETNLNYNYFRDYDPAVGRYVQSDPIGIEDDLNTYAYVHSRPLESVDPLGLGRAGINPNKGKICGSGWSFAFTPETYRGLVTFTEVCRAHDKCYDTCGRGKAECDLELRENARSTCFRAHPRVGMRFILDCLRRAQMMYNMVDWFGDEPYRKAQAKCKCAKP